MSDTKTTAETPTDAAPGSTKGKKVPARGKRKRVLGKGEGDYKVMEVATGQGDVPKGALLPLPNTPQFEKTVDAMKWIRNESGDTLMGKQIAVIAFKELLDIRVETKPVVRISAKQKVVVNDPTKDS